MGTGLRRGPLTAADLRFIASHRDRPAEYVAGRLSRAVPPAAAELARLAAPGPPVAPPAPPPPPPKPAAPAPARRPDPADDTAVLRARFRSTPLWRGLAKELEPDEAERFEREYFSLFDQFQGDVLATEETQIVKVVRYGILMSRNLARQKAVTRAVARCEADRDRILRTLDATPGGNEDVDGEGDGDDAEGQSRAKEQKQARAEVKALESRIREGMGDLQDLTVELSKLEEKHQKLLTDLKGTRQQREVSLASSKQSFLDLVKELMRDDERDRAGREMAQAGRAFDAELLRLAAPHKYADGNTDRPVLTAETVLLPAPGEAASPDTPPAE